jgi:ATP-dependent Lon protease
MPDQRMVASRWNANLREILNWFEDNNLNQNLGDLYLGMSLSDNNNVIKLNENQTENPDPGSESGELSVPDELPILPLRGLVVYPQTAVPLTIGQARSIRLVDDVISGNRIIGLVTARDPELDNPGPQDLYSVGTVAVIHRLFRTPDGTIRILIQGISRFHLGEFTSVEPYLKAKITPAPEIITENLEVEALARNARDQFDHIARMIPSIPRELVESITNITDPLQTAYSIANFERMELVDAQAILESDSVEEKLRKLVSILARESEVLDLGQKIQNEARSEIEKVQRDYFLHEQLKAIQKELGEGDETTEDVNELRKKIDEGELPEEALKQANRELERLSRLPTAAAEYGVIRSYIEWLAALPWTKSTEDNLDIANARKVLDEDHYGLKDVKERILEYLAVRKLRLERKVQLSAEERTDLIRKEREGVIICFVGPPGVGKTSLGQSIARALGRKFIRISLGGMRDEAEIRGHRRTYIGALPGRILQALRRAESHNPVFMLDEIDKLGFDFHGDPASALLEVLDPEQNFEFRDHYLEVAYDLSQVMFITTANSLETIPAPLLDRMEIIPIAGYTEREKLMIARNYLIPRQIKENGLLVKELHMDDDSILSVIRQYTREAGVRSLEREIGAICRKIVTSISEGKKRKARILIKDVHDMLGRPKFLGNEEIERRTSIPGVATGLAWTPSGGDILFIEASKMPGSKGFQITGSLGTVMQESAHAALTYVRSHAKELGIDPEFFQTEDIHLHVPAGATPKDGPSAGVTMTTALVSLLTNRPIRPDLGMTGEITLRGQILPVGGIKEKMLAAHRAGLKTIILPKLNEPDLDDLPKEVRDEMKFYLVEQMEEAIKIAIPKKKAK